MLTSLSHHLGCSAHIYYTLHRNTAITPSNLQSPLPYPYIPTLDDTDGISDHSGLLTLTFICFFFSFFFF